MGKSIEGIFAAAVTPMDEDGQVNTKALRELVRWEMEQGVEGFYLCGSSGEGLLLSLDERKLVLDTVLDEIGDRLPVIAHTGTIRTADAVELTKHAANGGARAVSMIPPYYYNFSHPEIIAYYEEVMNTVDIPMIIYNIPAFTGVSFNRKNSDQLLSNPQVVGIKHTSMDFYDLERMKTYYPDKTYFNGYDEVFLSGLAAGATSAVGTTINLFSKTFKRIRRLFLEGDITTALKLQSQINEVVETFVEIGIFNAVKYAFTLKGIDCGSCRSPFRPLAEHEKGRIEELMQRSCLN